MGCHGVRPRRDPPQGIVLDAHVAWRSFSPLVVVLTESLDARGFVSGSSYLTSGRDVLNVDQAVGCAYIAAWKVPGLARTNELREQLKGLPHLQIARLVVLLYVDQPITMPPFCGSGHPLMAETRFLIQSG